jgi:hypothetical protein
MAIIGKDGFKYSLDCDDLIEELEADIEEFGNETVRSYYHRDNGVKLYYDYQFIEDDQLEGKSDELDMKSLLQYLKAQNDPL